MASPAGISAQFGYKSEAVYGTGVVVDKFLPFVSEGIKQDIARMKSRGLRAGRIANFQWKPGTRKIAGGVNLELPNVNVAPLLKHIFGAVTTTGAGPYTHTFTPGDLSGLSFTSQIGRPDLAGTVNPFTYTGCKVAGAEFACSAGEIASLNLDLSAQAESTATGLAVATYPASWAPFVFTEGTLTIAGSAVNVKSASVKVDNNMAADRFRLGSAAIKEQFRNGMANYTGTVAADFESLTAYNRFVNGTESALVLAFNNGSQSLTITCNVEFDGDTPTVGGPDLLDQPLPFTCTSATSDAAAIQAVLVNTDVTAA